MKFRTYDASVKCTEPIIEGRVPSKWLEENMHKISKEDFYNQELTEDDLKMLLLVKE
jgi:hypothetical protein